MRLLFVFCLILFSRFPTLCAHDSSDHNTVEKGASIPAPLLIASGLPGSQVSITEAGGKRLIQSNGLPDHETGQFPGRSNPNTIREQNLHFEVTLTPKAGSRPRPVRPYLFGVALNGVKFDPGTAEFWNKDRSSGWNEEAIVDGRGRLGLDTSNAHVQPDGSYHYHGIPLGLVKQLNGDNRMVLLGWAADGFPVYGPWAHEKAEDAQSPAVEMKSSYQLKKGSRPGGKKGPGGAYDGTYTADFEFVEGSGTLDECNGRSGVTPEFPEGTYYYVLTRDFPNIPRMFRGTPDPSFTHPAHQRGPGGGGPGGGGRPDGPPDGPPPF